MFLEFVHGESGHISAGTKLLKGAFKLGNLLVLVCVVFLEDTHLLAQDREVSTKYPVCGDNFGHLDLEKIAYASLLVHTCPQLRLAGTRPIIAICADVLIREDLVDRFVTNGRSYHVQQFFMHTYLSLRRELFFRKILQYPLDTSSNDSADNICDA